MEVSMHSFTTMTNHVRWLRRVTLAVAVIMIGWGASVVLGQPVTAWFAASATIRSEEHTSELQSRLHLVCRLLLEKKKPTSCKITLISASNLNKKDNKPRMNHYARQATA